MKTSAINNSIRKDLGLRGYTVVPMLDSGECKKLTDLYSTYSTKPDKGFFCSMFSGNDERLLVNQGIKEIVEPHVSNLFPGYRILFTNFMIKAPGEESRWPVHQDWTYVDESEYNSFAIWIPLLDLNSENGALCMVPGSHHISNLVRGPGIHDPFGGHHQVIQDRLHTELEIKAGDAALWNHRTLHFSKANLSNEHRVAATAIIVPKEAKTYHFWKPPESPDKQIEKFSVDGNFFLANNIFERPVGVKVVDEIPAQHHDISRQALEQAFTRAMNDVQHDSDKLKNEMGARKVFKQPELQEVFDRDGYVVVDFLTENDLEELKRVLSGLQEKKEKQSFSTQSEYKLSFFADESSYRKLVFDTLGAFFENAVNRFLLNYEPLIVNTFDKQPGSGEVPIHQNWTFVDESKYTSVSVWIPLIDATRLNGTMEVVKGSHSILSKFRSPSIPWVFEDLLDLIREDFMIPIDTKLGQAVILDDSIVHFTSTNESDKVRAAIQLIMKPSEAPAIHYYKNQASDLIEEFEVDAEFFTKFKMNEKPATFKRREFVLDQQKLSEAEFRKRIPQPKTSGSFNN